MTPEPARPPEDPEKSDFTALRSLALVLGGMIAATWVLLEEPAIQALMTGVLVGILAVAMLAIYLRRWWRGRR